MRLIAVDLDGVTCDLHTEWYRRYNRDYNDNLNIERVTSWELHHHVKPECAQRIYDYLYDEDLYEHVKPVPGSYDAIQTIRADGDRPIFVTSCVLGMTDQKWRWLELNGYLRPATAGDRSHSDLIVANDKSLIDADVLIDDAPKNVLAWVQRRQRPALLFGGYPFQAAETREWHSAMWRWVTPVRDWGEVLAWLARS